MNRKNTLIGIFIIITILTVSFVAYQFIFDTIKQEIVNNKTRELTEKEKLIQQQSTELDALREQYQTRNTEQSTTSVQSQIKILDTFRIQAIKNKVTQPQKTASQQMEELDAFRLQYINSQK